jgi:E3 ubiquitin-protein ligase DOA10
MNHHDLENPFINLCLCKGSMSFIHFECLKRWMGCKLVIKQNEKKTVTSYNMKSFNCEICKTPYPCNN